MRRPKDFPKHLHWNTPAEEAAIQRGIAQDPDASEWTKEDFKQARRLTPEEAAVMTKAARDGVAYMRRMRGKQVAPVKELVSVRLDHDVLEQLRAGGQGWQTRLNALLRTAVLGRSKT